MDSSGVVRKWDDDQGFGVIDSADTPGGCWAHFSAIVTGKRDGYRSLTAGQDVSFSFEAAPRTASATGPCRYGHPMAGPAPCVRMTGRSHQPPTRAP